MQIYLARNNQQAGPYTLEQLNQMLASQQVLLTDLAWHQGMSEWKALGELTQGKLVYEPQHYVSTPPTPEHSPFQNTDYTATNTSRPSSASSNSRTQATKNELASINQRALAKIIDMLLWLPAAALPSFFLNGTSLNNCLVYNKKCRQRQRLIKPCNCKLNSFSSFQCKLGKRGNLFIDYAGHTSLPAG